MKPDLVQCQINGKTFFSSEEPALRDSLSATLMSVKGEFTQTTTSNQSGETKEARKFVVEELTMVKLFLGAAHLWLQPKTVIFIFNK